MHWSYVFLALTHRYVSLGMAELNVDWCTERIPRSYIVRSAPPKVSLFEIPSVVNPLPQIPRDNNTYNDPDGI